MDIKEGWKTTEFWVSISTALVGVGVAFGFFTPAESTQLMSSISQIVGGLMTIVPVVAYAISRGNAKANFDIEAFMAYFQSFVPQSTDTTTTNQTIDADVLAQAIATALDEQQKKLNK